LHQFHSMLAAAYRGEDVTAPKVPESNRFEDVGA
jgi:hypothetical protein